MTAARRLRLSVLQLCRQYDLPEPVAEHAFAAHIGRRFRFDWAWPERLVAVEEDGAVWTGGRHTRGAGFLRDCVKLNLAVELGWRVLRYESGKVDIHQLRRVLDGVGSRLDVAGEHRRACQG